MSIMIDRISFENYRQYGTGQIHFKTDGSNKLSILIAKNGTGKTTLLNAITWCLYGRELHLTEERKALPLVNSAVARNTQSGESIQVKEFRKITENLLTKSSPKVQGIGRGQDLPSSSTSRN